jgi:hypothetical protein
MPAGAIDELLDAPDVGVDFDPLLRLLREERQRSFHHAAVDADVVGPRPRHALDDDVQALRSARHLADDADRPHGFELVRLGIFAVALLQEQEQQPIAGERGIDSLDGFRPVDGERLQRQRKGDGSPKGKDGEFRGKYCGRSRVGHGRWRAPHAPGSRDRLLLPLMIRLAARAGPLSWTKSVERPEVERRCRDSYHNRSTAGSRRWA